MLTVVIGTHIAAGITAVIAGPKLPLWNLLPPSSFWILPVAIGLPLIARALLRHSTPKPTTA